MSIDSIKSVRPLPGRRVLNAENLTITKEGRLFVTGSEAVYERASDGTLNKVPVKHLPQDCMKNGISADGEFLYLACASIHGGENTLVPESWCRVNTLDQSDFFNFLRIIVAEKHICQVGSYIVRANLEGEVSFDRVVATKDATFFANGLASDASGLYVANSFPSASAGIYTAPHGGDSPATLEFWHCRPGCVPNGLKVGRRAVYYTGFILLPVPSSVLIRVEKKVDGSPGESEVLYTRTGAFFDDFDILENEAGFEAGFIVADVGEFSTSLFGTGALLFLDKDGRLVNTVKHDHLKHPSAVKIVGKKTGQFDKGDILVTEKSGGCLVWLRPEGSLEDNLASPRKAGPVT